MLLLRSRQLAPFAPERDAIRRLRGTHCTPFRNLPRRPQEVRSSPSNAHEEERCNASLPYSYARDNHRLWDACLAIVRLLLVLGHWNVRMVVIQRNHLDRPLGHGKAFRESRGGRDRGLISRK